MNITDINLIYKPQSKPQTDYSSRPQNQDVYSKTMQHKISDEYLAGGITYFDLSINYNVSASAIQRWVEKRRGFKRPREDYTKYPDDLRVKIINLAKSCSHREVASRTGVPVSTVGKIIRDAKTPN